MSLKSNLQQIFLMILLDMIVSVGIAAWLYFTKGFDVAIYTGLSIFISFSPICLTLAPLLTLHFTKKKIVKLGIKPHNPESLKTLADVNVVALPFNRILTCNDYCVTDMVPFGMSQNSLLSMAASVERESGNILGRTVYDTAMGRTLKIQGAINFKEFPGRGVEAVVNRTLTRVGSLGWLEEFETAVSTHLRSKVDQFLAKGKTPLVVATGKIARGIIALKDEFNDDAKTFLARLNKARIKSLLLTAQPKKMIESLEQEDFLLDYVRTNLTPEGKAREVQVFRAKGGIVAVIGNDENDLPALKAADVSFFIQGGTLSSFHAKNVKLDFEIPKLKSFLYAREIALTAASILNINRGIAFLSWIVLVPLAILSAWIKLPIPFNPLVAAAGVAIFSVCILINSSRIE